MTMPTLSPPPFWMEDVSPDPRGARGVPWTGGRIEADVAVIGAGLAGLSAALHLLRRRPDRRVVVLEAGAIGDAAACRSTGMLTPGVGQNFPAQVRRLGADRAAQLYRESLQAVEGVAQLCRDEEIDARLRLTGQLVLAYNAAGAQRLARTAQVMEELDLPVERLDAAGLAARVQLPGLQVQPPGAGPAALRFSTAGVLHPGHLLTGLAGAVQARGGVIYEGARVCGVDAGRPARVTLQGSGLVVARDVVLATDGHSGALGIARGRIIPLQLRALVTEPLPPAILARVGWAGREGIIDSRRLFSYLRLTDDNRVLMGGGRPLYRGGPTTAPTRTSAPASADRFARGMLAALSALLGGGPALAVARRWNGVIGYVLDGLPVIERLPDRPSVVLAAGWCGHGIALGLAAGAWVGALIDEDVVPGPLACLHRAVPRLPTHALRTVGVPLVTGVMQGLDRFF